MHSTGIETFKFVVVCIFCHACAVAKVDTVAANGVFTHTLLLLKLFDYIVGQSTHLSSQLKLFYICLQNMTPGMYAPD